jgi:hypothetical protein
MQDESKAPDDYDVTLASTEVTPTFPGLPELADEVNSSKIAESINRATCVVICTDRTELRRFLRCASLHYDLGAKGVLEAYRVGKWDALVLRQATGDGSWASLGLSVKPGCRPALIGKTARGVPLSAPPARLFSEKDLVDLYQPSGRELPSPILEQRNEVQGRALAHAFESCGMDVSLDVRAALKLRHGITPPNEELECPETIDTKEALYRCRQVVIDLRAATPAFDEALRVCLDAELAASPSRVGNAGITGVRQRKGRRPSEEHRRGTERDKVERRARDDRAELAAPTATHAKPSESALTKPSPPTSDFDLTFQDPTRRPSPAQLFELFRDGQ